MNRRAVIALVCGAAMVWPLVTRAQQSAMPTVGILNGAAPGEYARFVAAFKSSLAESGYVEGRNLAIDHRSAQGQYERLPDLATELVRREVTVILAIGGGASALAAKAATTRIPIVFVNGSDPVGLRLVESINRPGANVTGVSLFGANLEAKRLEVLNELVPSVTKLGVLINLSNPNGELQAREVVAAASLMGKRVRVLNGNTDVAIAAAFAAVVEERLGGLHVAIDPFLLNRRDQLVALAARHAVPTIYALRDYVLSGGLASYGTDLVDGFRQAGVYVGRILRGVKPADLPVLQPTKFELLINLKTAKALGLDVPTTLLARADEVIE
jgi:putative tryptophan/tyrosine transport system substrate-binding protein